MWCCRPRSTQVFQFLLADLSSLLSSYQTICGIRSRRLIELYYWGASLAQEATWCWSKIAWRAHVATAYLNSSYSRRNCSGQKWENVRIQSPSQTLQVAWLRNSPWLFLCRIRDPIRSSQGWELFPSTSSSPVQVLASATTCSTPSIQS